jgi:hypothetical protein
VTAVMPDFFQERKNKKGLQDFYASKRVIRAVLPHSHDPHQDVYSESDTFSFSGTSESSASQLYHDNLIQQWLEELNNEDQMPHLYLDSESVYIPQLFDLILH